MTHRPISTGAPTYTNRSPNAVGVVGDGTGSPAWRLAVDASGVGRVEWEQGGNPKWVAEVDAAGEWTLDRYTAGVFVEGVVSISEGSGNASIADAAIASRTLTIGNTASGATSIRGGTLDLDALSTYSLGTAGVERYHVTATGLSRFTDDTGGRILIGLATGRADVSLNKAAASEGYLRLIDGATASEWRLTMDGTEDFHLDRYPSGVFSEEVFAIDMTSGNVALATGVVASRTVQIGSVSSGRTTIYGGGVTLDAGSSEVQVGDDTGSRTMQFRKGSGSSSALEFWENGSALFRLSQPGIGGFSLQYENGAWEDALSVGAVGATVTLGSQVSTSTTTIRAGTGGLSLEADDATLSDGTAAVAFTLDKGSSSAGQIVFANAGSSTTGAGRLNHTASENIGLEYYYSAAFRNAISGNTTTGEVLVSSSAVDHDTAIGATTGGSKLALRGGTEGVTLETDAVSDPAEWITIEDQTTDASNNFITLDALSVNGEMMAIEFFGVGVVSDGSDAVSRHMSRAYYRTGGTTTSAGALLDSGLVETTDLAYSIGFGSVSGGAPRIVYSGIAATTINWTFFVRVKKHLP